MAKIPRVVRRASTCGQHLGAVAQLVAHLHGMQRVRGSSPLSSTEIMKRRYEAQLVAGSRVKPEMSRASYATRLRQVTVRMTS